MNLRQRLMRLEGSQPEARPADPEAKGRLMTMLDAIAARTGNAEPEGRPEERMATAYALLSQAVGREVGP